MPSKFTVSTLPDDEDLSKWHHFTSSGLHNYWLSRDLVVEEKIEGDTFYSYPQFDNIMAAIGLHICELPRILGPREIKFLRVEMEMSQMTLGTKLGYTDAQSVNLAESLNNERVKPLPKAEDALLRKFYLAVLMESEGIEGFLCDKANSMHKEMDAQHTVVEIPDIELEQLLVA